jgi:type I restriction enzyme S subunit
MEAEGIPFSELLSEVIDNRGKTCPTAERGIPLIATNCIRNELLYPTYDKVRYVSQETYDTWFRGHPQPGDIIFVNKATPGRVCLVPDPIDFCIAQDMVAVRANPKKVYPKYLFAVLRSPEIQGKIEQMHVGTLIPHFKKGDFNKLLLPVPEREMQEFIGDTYFNFSNKIELNRRRNETLEALAQSLFKSWFVDATQSALPKGWRDGVVEDLGDIICGKTPPTSVPANYGTDIPFITIPDMHGRMFVTRTGKSLSQQGADTQPTKTLPPYSICVSCIATPGLVILTSQPCQTNQQINSVVPNTGYSPFYCYFALRELSEEIRSRGSGGSVTANLNKGDFAKIPIALPPVELSKQFQELTEPVFKRILSNEHESRTLAALRDALLPKLLSGELRVPAAAKLMEAKI